MAKKPWGLGAWAAESELAESQLEQEEQQQQHQQHQPSPFAGDAAFPPLGEAVHAKVPKKKKQTVSLAKFIAAGPQAFSESKGLTTEEKMALPTGPRDRSGEETPLGGLGGGFKDYGGSYRGEGRDREYGRDREGGRRSDREGGFGRGFAGDRDGPDEPSRADTTDDWGASKKFAPPSRGRYEDDGRRGSRFDDRDFPSKADDDSHWGSSKKFVPAPPSNGASRRVSKYDFSSSRSGDPLDSSSKADEADSWAAAKKSMPAGGYEAPGQRDRDFWNSREKDGVDGDTWTRREAERATERPRLVLQPRTQPLDSSPPPPIKEDTENQPPTAEVPIELPSKPSKVNPFGEAKPREVILEEKGLSWKKADVEVQQKSSDRGEELALKEEIKTIQEAIKLAEAASSEGAAECESSEKLADLKEQLTKKEGELEQLRAVFNDKISSFRGGSTRDSDAWTAGNRTSARDSDAWSKHASNGRSVPERKSRW
eukprot:c38064_g1_i1 orf=226-1677(+)